MKIIKFFNGDLFITNCGQNFVFILIIITKREKCVFRPYNIDKFKFSFLIKFFQFAHVRTDCKRYMSILTCHYCEEFGHIQVICSKVMKYLRSLKEKTKNLKSAPSTNVISYDDDVILLCKDTIDNQMKICETLNEEI
jgi:hypothetical protein